jgi:hypothetical protein
MERAVVVLSWFVLSLSACSSCNKGSSENGPKPASSTTPASTPPATDEEIFCKAQPYKRRCEKACKEAQAKAITTTCKDETSAYKAWSESETKFGKCMLECTKPGGDSTCIGAIDKATCDCQLKCYEALPKDVLERARAAARCYQKETASACQ